MSIIKILPENLVNQIAAGEVVERPASVVKELLENSIDAGADYIILEIKGAGDELIKLTDNGHGMDKIDAKLAIERHATSKISNNEDLFSISTLGFRGEAIASIASVSQLTLQTKLKEQSVGTKIVCLGGKIEKNEDCSCPEGTQIEVKNLFYNTPARKKYLKTLSTEYQHVLRTLQGIALVHPHIHFKLIHNEKSTIEYPRADEMLDRVRAVLGKHTSDNCLPIFYNSNDIKIEGFIGKPELARSGTKHQHLFVNNRQINHPLFSYALAQSYQSLLMHGKKPFYVINIKISPDLIDVNVHPRKLEIRFINQSEIFSILQRAAKSSLEKNVLMPSVSEESKSYNHSRFSKMQFNDLNVRKPSSGQIRAAFEFNKNLSENSIPGWESGRYNKYSYKQEDEAELSMIPIAQIAKSYIVAESAEGIVLIDQHAAHERVKFEELMEEFEKKEPSAQQLLIPQNIELSAVEAQAYLDNLDTFKKLGFEIELFGGNTFIIQAVPTPIAQDNVDNIVINVLNDLANVKKTTAVNDPQIKILEYMSCRSAVKFGDILSLDEMISLIKQLDCLKRPYTCPHGRPTMIKLSFDELEKRFKRK